MLRVLVVIAALVSGGTIAGAVQSLGTARELTMLRSEIAQLERELAAARDTLRRGCLYTPHEDEALLYSVALAYDIPAPVLYSVIAVESGYRANYTLRGKRGEYGRAQIRRELWPCRWDQRGQIECAARILTACKRRFSSWRLAVGCYNRWARPNPQYIHRVERELGRMILRQYDATQK